MEERQEEDAPRERKGESRLDGPRAAAKAGESRKTRAHKLEKKVEELERDLEETRDKYLRALADLDNLRKRMGREQAEIIKNASERLIAELLEILDVLDEAVAAKPAAENTESFVEGLRLLRERLRSILEKEGLVEIESVGQPFDPNIHEAVMQVESDEHPSDTVAQELRKGYRLHERLLRAAKVAVAR